MKIASILAGVALAALTASAASAGDINQGQTQLPFVGTTNVGGGFLGGLNNANAQWGGSPTSSWHAVGESAGNNGNAASSDGATFTLKGSVSTDCAYYSGTGDHTLNFGTIGIYASDNTGPAAAFTMTDDASVEINTNLAGCNTVNTVTVSKVNMVSDNSGGYDANVFQNTLPFSVNAKYTASPTSGTGTQAANWTVPANALSDFRKHGAWKSAMSLNVNIAQQPKALLAGNYTGSVSVTIAAGI
ncbi:hypothetical protein [Brevundimonas sp. NPDC058933]|uniref:hypothetical protein n=1 Tax=Brevundimonas sp. NPDC058933 TaxID=3346673 RepID=UPI003BEEE6B4